MNFKKTWILIVLAVFCMVLSAASVSAEDNLTDGLNVADDTESVEVLDSPQEDVSLSQSEDDNSTLSAASCDEILAAQDNFTDNVLSTSASVSSGHKFHVNGYTFKVSDSQYKKIKKAIKAGRKQTFLDWGFEFTVKTDKVVKVKQVVKKQTYYKKVLFDGLIKSTRTRVILGNLKKYDDNGWQRYEMSYKPASKNSKYVGFHYVHFKKTVKTYKTVKKRVYAHFYYVGKYDYETGQQAFFPWISFIAKKSGYPDDYQGGVLLTSYK